MNFRKGFMIPPDQELPMKLPWTPVTPDKPIPTRCYPNSVDDPALHQRGGYWHELLRSSGGLSQEMPSYRGGAENVDLIRSSSLNGSLQDPNFIAMKNPQGLNSGQDRLFGTDLEEFGMDGAAWNNIRLTDLLSSMNAAASLSSGNGPPTNSNNYLVNRPQAPDFYSQLQTSSNLSNPHMAMLMLADQNCLNLRNQNHPFSVSTPQNGFPVPNKCNYNLNPSPAPEVVATSRVQSSSLAPATDQAKLEFSHNGMLLNQTLKESSCQDKEKQENNLNAVVSTRDADAERNCFEFSQHLVELSPAALSTTTNKNNFNEVGHLGIDLNETPSQKPPKRRKHRPKVVAEGKPKRTPKRATPEKPKEKPSGKRKYVRRKGVNASTPQPEEVTKMNVTPTPKSKTKSCKRTLNFDLEGKTIDGNKEKIDSQQKIQHPGGMLVFNLNAVGQERELLPGSQSIPGTNSSVQNDQRSRRQADIKQSEINPILNHPTSQMVPGHMLLPRNNAPDARSTTNKGQNMENSSASIQNSSTRNSNNYQDDRRNVQITSDQQSLNEGIGQAVLQAINHHNLERAGQLKMWNNHQSLLKDLTYSNLGTGIKRVSWHTTEQTHPQMVNQIEPLPFKAANDNNNSSHLGTVPENQKRQKLQDGHVSALSTRPYSNCRLENISKQVQTNCTTTINASHLTSEQEHRNLTSRFRENDVLAKLTSSTPVAGSYIPSMDSGPDLTNKCTSSDLPQQAQRTNKRSRKATHVQDSVSPSTNSKSRKQPSTKQNPSSTDEQRIKTGCADLASSSQNVMPVAFDLAPPDANKGLPQQNGVNDHPETHKRTQGFQKKHSYLDAVDEIMSRLNRIDLSKESNIAGQERNALVLYKGDDALVPFDPIKKIKPPRPKVDLDPETNRVWNLLMGKEGSQGFEETDKEKEKWWEEERRVFQGRADSFIARMHLVQGDRRFSRWKGSVVDSVIGVFLTQNVSDHLSSSAFMSLAARFPFQSNNRSCRKDEVILVEESEICIIEQDDAIKWRDMVPREPIQKQNSASVYDPSGQIKATMMPSLGGIQSRRLEEDAASSQDSFDSSLLQVNGEVRSSSGSNSEAEDAATKSNADQLQCSTPPNLLYDEFSIFQKFFGQQTSPSYGRIDHGCMQPKELKYGNEKQRFGSIGNLKDWSSVINHSASSQSPQMHNPPYISQLHMPQYTEPPKADSFELLGEEIISLPSTSEYDMISSKKFDCISRRFEKMAENTRGSTIQGMAQSKFQELPRWDQCAPSGIYQNQQDDGSPPGAYPKINEHLCINHPYEKLRIMQQASPAVAKPSEVVQAQRNWKNCNVQQSPHTPEFNPAISDVEERTSEVDKQVFIGSTAIEQKTNESAHSAVDAYTGTNSNTPKTTKGRAPVDKRHAFDWDSLRKQVKTQERKRESSRDTLDSLNYEALRCAAVEEISDAIKERGMNKMLAERIKDFLNRLVEDHGSIDLEWLRDVPPDKAKEYLLSIRGLGLKSVECVRLLTLHHVAFPVDTNVGRIAVRLGWVPLQPLPESLQLHLLELYPVLETIQKYLWPRLCKLDQRTLYELHYQMITFGKVFCTKRTPNCNACPMRGECRHFASAFASARLALPGPEEKGLVSSSVPIATKGDSAIPMLLPLLENTQLGLASRISNSEPIIEEPASPEPEHELTQSDIEDAYYEDSDEIPLIKLNMEEFTQNLQNYMESNMEIQEGDMSKALVALSAEAANIPVPKLKNMSRLRTEHQVYELPDSHPLLKEMDKREEDDPSPYLLSIWTPGETANSIQPPGNSCGKQEMGKLCNNTTCFSCNSEREANSLTVRGTLLIPCRTAMRGSFPLNGTYFQVNEVFADHESSLKPIEVPRAWLWNLPRRTVYFGTSVSTIFK
ncbi:Permuted single zf-CXXC unit, partial [Dillenia turbinata]